MIKKKDYSILYEKIISIITNPKAIFAFFILITLLASMQKYFINAYPVYTIYKVGALRMLSFENIYQPPPGMDVFIYSPFFAAFFLIFAHLPDFLGSIFWNLLSVALFILSINLIKVGNTKKAIIFAISFFSVLVSIQHFQANTIAIAIILFSFAAFESNHYIRAAFFVSLGFFFKVIGLGFAVLFIFHKNKLRFFLAFPVIFLALFLIPLFFLGFNINYYLYLYKEWYIWMTAHYHNGTAVFRNVFSILEMCFHCGFYSGKIVPLFYIIELGSLVVLALPLLRVSKYKNFYFRLMFLSSLLIWVTIFNPKAESPTYIIAMTGVAIWFISQKVTCYTILLLAMAIIFTSLTATDLTPHYFRVHFIQHYSIKAFPCITIWIVAQIQLLFMKFKNETVSQKNQ